MFSQASVVSQKGDSIHWLPNLNQEQLPFQFVDHGMIQ